MERLIVASNRGRKAISALHPQCSTLQPSPPQTHLSEENVQQIYDQIADDMQMRASTQNRVLVTDIPPTLPTVAADANSIGEVIGNLIDNAIKQRGWVNPCRRTTNARGFVEVSTLTAVLVCPITLLPTCFINFIDRTAAAKQWQVLALASIYARQSYRRTVGQSRRAVSKTKGQRSVSRFPSMTPSLGSKSKRGITVISPSSSTVAAGSKSLYV